MKKRTIYCISMFHELESNGPKISEFIIAKFGKQMATDYQRLLEKYWKEVWLTVEKEALFSHNKSYPTYVFVDSFSSDVTKEKAPTVLERLMAAGHELPMCLLIKRFIGNGAVFHGVENKKLLLRFLNLVVAYEQMMDSGVDNAKIGVALRAMGRNISARDLFIAKHIAKIVPERGRAIVLMGLAHDIAGKLKKLYPGEFNFVNIVAGSEALIKLKGMSWWPWHASSA